MVRLFAFVVRTMFRLFVAASVAWALLSVVIALYARMWLRERDAATTYPASQAEALLNPMRAWLQPVPETVGALGLAEGDTVLELGPGPGYFSTEAARTVGERGRIVALDLQPEMVRMLDGRMRERDVPNVLPLAGDAMNLPFADGSLDAAFLVTVMGEVPDRPRALFELRRALKAGGVLAFVESLSDPDYQSQRDLRDLCQAVGFTPRDHTRQRLGYIARFAAPGW
jgi:ubiquinone/menaquinone biosynthesis C-methylase UbiE